MRLNKYIAICGIASRRQADELIRVGKVNVNGEVVDKHGIIINPRKDIVIINGKRCVPHGEHVYIALNKPSGYVCTHARFRGERSIFQLLPKQYKKLKIAGRLDKDSEGLVLLSNDGDFIYGLTHPRYKHEKEYEVLLNRPLSKQEVERLKRGVKLPEGIARADSLEWARGATYYLVLHQGWKRQIRRMFEKVSHEVVKLKRIRVGKLKLNSISQGEFRNIEKIDVI